MLARNSRAARSQPNVAACARTRSRSSRSAASAAVRQVLRQHARHARRHDVDRAGTGRRRPARPTPSPPAAPGRRCRCGSETRTRRPRHSTRPAPRRCCSPVNSTSRMPRASAPRAAGRRRPRPCGPADRARGTPRCSSRRRRARRRGTPGPSPKRRTGRGRNSSVSTPRVQGSRRWKPRWRSSAPGDGVATIMPARRRCGSGAAGVDPGQRGSAKRGARYSGKRVWKLVVKGMPCAQAIARAPSSRPGPRSRCGRRRACGARCARARACSPASASRISRIGRAGERAELVRRQERQLDAERASARQRGAHRCAPRR